MLTIFSSSGKPYSLWCHHFVDINSNTGTNVEVIVTDGCSIWRNGVLTGFNAQNDKPVSRKHEDNEEFMRKVIKAMTSTDSVLFEVSFVENQLATDHSQCLTIKIAEKMSSNAAKTLLFKGNLPLSIDSHSDNNRPLSMELFQSISSKMKADEAIISGLTNDIDLYRQQINSLHGDLKELCMMKENLQNDLMLSMCMVLNTKKREIVRLRNALSHSGVHVDDPDAVEPSEPTATAIDDGKNRVVGNKRSRKDDQRSGAVAIVDVPASPIAVPSSTGNSAVTTPNSRAADSVVSSTVAPKAAAPARALSKKQQIEIMKQNLLANRNKQQNQSATPVVAAIDVKISPIKEAAKKLDGDDDSHRGAHRYDDSVCSAYHHEDNCSISTDDTSLRSRNRSSATNHDISDRSIGLPLGNTSTSQPDQQYSSSQAKSNVGSNRITSRFLAEDDSD